MSQIRAWASAPSTMFGAFVASVVVTYLIPKQTQWLPQVGAVAVPIPLFPIPSYIWQTVGWIALLGLFTTLLITGENGMSNDWPDRSARRATMLTLAAMWAFSLVARIVTGKASEPSMGPFAVIAAAGLIVTAAIIALRPPRATAVIGGILLAAVAVRLIGIALTPLDKDYSDNLPAIVVGLERLVHGQTPYAFIDFGTHVNPLGYLPWTILGYLPAFVAGFDIRVTNVLLSLAAAVTVLLLVARLALPRKAGQALGLLVVLVYAAPNAIGFDLYTEWQFFSFALILTFALLTMGRLRIAAVSFGFALAAMPTALYCAPALCGYVIRKKGWREFAILAAIAAAVTSPIAVFLLWDRNAFIGAFTSAPLEYWQRLDSGDASWPYLLAWHGILLGQLRILQFAILAIVGFLAWQVRTPLGALRVAIVSYLGLTLSGPFIAPHIFSPVLLLVLIATATRVAERSDASRDRSPHARRPNRVQNYRQSQRAARVMSCSRI